MYLNDIFTVPVITRRDPGRFDPEAGHPPGGGKSLPVGLQLIGPAFSEDRLLSVAFALEQSLGFDGSARVDERAGRRSSASRFTSS